MHREKIKLKVIKWKIRRKMTFGGIKVKDFRLDHFLT